MTPIELKQVVLAALRQIAPEVDPATVVPSQPLREQYDLDSMDYLRFIVALNQRLGVEVPEGDYPQLTSLNECVGYLSTHLLGPGHAAQPLA